MGFLARRGKHLPPGQILKIMWDSGFGNCVVCGKNEDRDILGRCDGCFRKGVVPQYGSFKEMGVENPDDPKGSTSHVRDIKMRMIDPESKKVTYYKPPKTYFFPKG